MPKNTLSIQILIYLLLSTLIVIFSKFFHVLLIDLNLIYAFAHLKLTPFFNYIGLGVKIKKITLLILVPVGLALIPALIYRVVKGRWMTHFIELTWILWLVLILSHILIH